jgi:RNA polymerase sigma factor (sigma-70 family)
LARRPEEYATDVGELRNTVGLASGATGVGAVQVSQDEFDRVVERDAIIQAMRRLTPQQRAVVVLRYLEDMSVQETADALGCATGTVKAHTSRALERLHTEMQAVTTKRPGIGP